MIQNENTPDNFIYAKGQKIKLPKGNKEIIAEVLRVDDDGSIILYTDVPIMGHTINKYTKSEVDAMCVGLLTQQEPEDTDEESEDAPELESTVQVLFFLAIIGNFYRMFTNAFTIGIGIGIHSFVSLCAIVSFILMLKCNKWGYYLYLITAFLSFACNVANGGDIIVYGIASIVMVGLVSAVLLIRKNGISAFRAMGINIG